MHRMLWSALLLIVLSGSAEAVTLQDIANHPYRDSIQELVSRGIVQGYADGTFKPNMPINRAEFLKILMLAVFGEEVFNVTSTACFFDFGTQVQWYYPHACTAKDLGIVGGYPDGTFRGESTVNLVEALKMSIEAWEIPLPQYVRAPDHWYDPYIDVAATKGVFATIPLVPDFPLTRGEAAELLVRLGQPLQALDPSFAEEQLKVLSRQDLEDAIQELLTPDPACGNGLLERGEACDDGNTENDDGCSEICIIVPQPVRHGALRIEQRPLGTLNVARGAQDVLLFSFDAIAGRQDIFLTQLKFTVGAGTLGSGRNYRLYYDRDGDGTAEKDLGNAVPQNENLTFANLSIPVSDGFYTRVEVHGDVASSGTVDDFSLQFDVSEPDYIEGVDAVDGEDVIGIETDDVTCQLVSICWITVYTDTPRLLSVGTQGSLFVTRDSSPVRSRQLLAGELSDVLLRFKFRAAEEDVAVTKISVSGGSDSIDSLELFEQGASAPFATARKSSCDTVSAGYFCADTDFLVMRDT
ncbi:MAG TPA: S-layer homology domain-containing protein, partial [Candidatus Peribacteraceae bacterium]|nr:S-layer homology domain-containing protein [Candidatus Peribacteraceae bacterium]